MHRHRTAAWPTAVVVALVGCTHEIAGPTDGSGGAGGGGTSASNQGPSTSGAVIHGGWSSAVDTMDGATTSYAPGGCTVAIFAEADLAICSGANCCPQVTACELDRSSCFGEDGQVDTSLPAAAEVYACMYFAGCFRGGPVCDSGIQFGDETSTPEQLEFAYCIDQNCCAEANVCTDGGADAEGCVACFDGEGFAEVCEDLIECMEDSCQGDGPDHELCDSELTSAGFGAEGDACVEDNCCGALNACSDFGADEGTIQACFDCLQAGGGPLCDAVFACYDLSCDTSICDSGLLISDLEMAACLSENCCDEHTACAGDGSEDDIQACIDCFAEDGGPLCDAAIACTEQLCGDLGAGGGG